MYFSVIRTSASKFSMHSHIGTLYNGLTDYWHGQLSDDLTDHFFLVWLSVNVTEAKLASSSQSHYSRFERDFLLSERVRCVDTVLRSCESRKQISACDHTISMRRTCTLIELSCFADKPAQMHRLQTIRKSNLKKKCGTCASPLNIMGISCSILDFCLDCRH